MGDGRLIALSMRTEAVISAARPDSISDVNVSPLIFSLMCSSPFLSSRPFSFPLLSPMLTCPTLSSCPALLSPFSLLSLLIVTCALHSSNHPRKTNKTDNESILVTSFRLRSRSLIEPPLWRRAVLSKKLLKIHQWVTLFLVLLVTCSFINLIVSTLVYFKPITHTPS